MRRRAGEQEEDREREEAAPAPDAVPAPAPAAASLLTLQRGAGNQAVARLVGARGPAALARRTIPLEGVGSPGSTLFDWEGDKDDSEVSFGWSVGWEDADRTGALDVAGIKVPALNDRVVDDPKGATTHQTLKVQAGRTGRVTVRAKARFFIDMEGDDNVVYEQVAQATWSVTVSPEGAITLGATPPSTSVDPPPQGARAALVAGAATADPASGELAISVPFVGSQRTATTSESSGWGIDVDIPVPKVPIGIGGQSQETKENSRADPAPSGTQVFTAKLEVVGAKPKEPTGNVEIVGPVRAFVNKTHDVDFKKRDNSRLPADERDKLLDWYFGLSALTRKRLKLGKQPLQLDAFASQTQPSDKNQKLAERRQAAVIEVLGRFVSPDNWPKHATAYGEDLLREDRKGKEEEDPTMWSVRLKVVDEVTPDADPDLEGFSDLMPE